MKEQILIEMRNKIETLANIANQLIKETNNIKQLAVGTLQTIKQMPDYEQAIEKLKDQAAEQSSEEKEIDSLGKDSN
jgi:cell shape-determining protein MreC